MNPQPLRAEAECMMTNSLPLLLRFLRDRQPDIPLSVSNFVSDLLRMVSAAS